MEESKKFVVQKHQKESEPVHWDLMLENGTVLETYRVSSPPEDWGDKPVEAVRIFEHPLKFLSYEGSVNKGKARVEIADYGTYRIIEKDETQQQILFTGKLLRGEFRLCLIENDRWEIIGF